MTSLPPLPRGLSFLVLLLALGLAACAGDDGAADDDGSDLGTTSSIAPPVTLDVPEASAPGNGSVVIGGITSPFDVTECTLEPVAEDAPELLRVTGAGTRGNGVPFSVEVLRTATQEADETFTDVITYMDTARILQVQRSEVAGEVTDLKDPDARSTLLRVRPDGLSATGIAGPPGTSAPEGPGLVGLALDATCD
ncbi:MAG: hypothetical protein ABWZ52_01740 [Acidimicrobiales bacterium]